MLIELFGLPGSGKTFISKALVEDKRCVIARRKNITVKRRLYFFFSKIRHKILWSYFFKILLSKTNLLGKLRRLYGLILLEKYQNDTSQIITYDQHLIQYLISFYMITSIKPNCKDVISLLNCYEMPKRSIIVYNDIAVSIVCKRFVNRKNSVKHNKTLLDNLSNEELFDYMYRLKEIGDAVLKIIESLKFKVIHWKGSEPYEIQNLIQELKEEFD